MLRSDRADGRLQRNGVSDARDIARGEGHDVDGDGIPGRMRTVTQFARALDQEDYATAAGLLHPECVYTPGGRATTSDSYGEPGL